MVAIPAGHFAMGSGAREAGRFQNEGPQHLVAIRAFARSKYDVTSEEFLTFLRDRLPAQALQSDSANAMAFAGKRPCVAALR